MSFSSNSQIGPGTVSGQKPPSGDHANIISGSVNGSDVADNSLRGADIADEAASILPDAAGCQVRPDLRGIRRSDEGIYPG